MLSDLTEEAETEMGYGTLTLKKANSPKVTSIPTSGRTLLRLWRLCEER